MVGCWGVRLTRLNSSSLGPKAEESLRVHKTSLAHSRVTPIQKLKQTHKTRQGPGIKGLITGLWNLWELLGPLRSGA